jgi:hypothetical protein
MIGRGRYDGLEVASTLIDDGAGGEREVRYLRRRQPPEPSVVPPLALHRVVPDDRLDLLSVRHFGDPAAFWRICDANTALDPDALVARDAEGSVVVVPVPAV